VWHGHINSTKVIAPITLDLDENGFITHFSTLVSAHFVIGGIVSVQQDGSYDHPQAVDESVWSAFNSEQKANDGKQ